MTKRAIQRAVYKGAKFLDEHFGTTRWRKMIDPETLALNSGSACILGQIYGDYDVGCEKLAIQDVLDRTSYGFTLWGAKEDDWETLNDAWLEELAKDQQ